MYGIDALMPFGRIAGRLFPLGGRAARSRELVIPR